jgi:hypothetical protein
MPQPRDDHILVDHLPGDRQAACACRSAAHGRPDEGLDRVQRGQHPGQHLILAT